MSKGKDILYSSDGERWFRTEWKPQCPNRVLITGKCQGVWGHKGVDWCYSPSGDLQTSKPGKGGSIVPPGHKNYKTPEEMRKLHYLTFKETVEVTDKLIIARLELNDPPEEGAGVDRPVREDEWQEEWNERLPSEITDVEFEEDPPSSLTSEDE